VKYADVIVNISLDRLDKTFQYRIPKDLEAEVRPGVRVDIPFGARTITGYVMEISEIPKIEVSRIRELIGIAKHSVTIEAQLMELAAWMKERYDCTMNQALMTVLPAKKKVAKGRTKVEQTPLPEREDSRPALNAAQEAAVEGILETYPKPALLFGVTGSGKTEVYMELIARMIAAGKQTILLIPEISLTYQNVSRFYRRFGERVGVINSRLSAGEKYETLKKAEAGELNLVIGPRSALFAPFPNLGMIIVDEEHEGAYNSEQSPRYKAVETAVKRGELAGAGVVLGSATPSVETYTRALEGTYGLFRLPDRAKPGSVLPEVQIVDLRAELREGNRSIFSTCLSEAIADRLAKKEQIMLFLNRRGYSGFVSCRSCGKVLKCPHCDVSLTAHRDRSLHCHYCGYTASMPDACPACGSPYLAGFGLGTQKVESYVKKQFPEARVLRMDLDTTKGKDGHSRILTRFAAGEADILIGTQMIVKGHDFPKVTLVGILAADMSLFSEDFRAAERTFQLLTQAAGRAGRAEDRGLVVIQTYSPDNATILAAAAQNYEIYYKDEMEFRKLLAYPPSGNMMSILITGDVEENVIGEAEYLASRVRENYSGNGVVVVGPTSAGAEKLQDRYRRIFYVKHPDSGFLLRIRDELEGVKLESLQADLL